MVTLLGCSKRLLCSLVLIAANTTASAQDEAAVKAVVDHWRQAWEHFDASVLRGDYAGDADWLNAFGVRKKGGPEIVAFVSQVVQRPNLHDRRTTWGEVHVRFVRPDVAVAYRDYQTAGHKLPDGRELPERRTHANWVLTKDGATWHITLHIISDEL